MLKSLKSYDDLVSMRNLTIKSTNGIRLKYLSV